MFGEFPEFEPGHYTFLGDYVPWGGGDGMEHRNSTVVAAPVSLRTPGMVADVLDTVSHEFFHAWNVERIRPKTLEPFNFEEANISGELWLAEGFTQYYGTLIMGRTGLSTRDETAAGLARAAVVGHQQPRPPVSIGRADEPDGAVHRRRARRRQDQFLDDVHLVLHLRLRRRARARPQPARSIEREALARRLHAGDVAGARQARRRRSRGWSPSRTRWRMRARVSPKCPAIARSPTSSSTSTSKVERSPTTRACCCAPDTCCASATRVRRGLGPRMSSTAAGRSTT